MTDTGEPAPPRRGVWHGLWASLLIGLGIPALVVLAVGAAWLQRIPIAEWVIERGAVAAGIGPTQVSVTRFEPTVLELADIRLSKGATAENVTVTYRLTDLPDRHVDEIRVTGLALAPDESQAGEGFDLANYLSDDTLAVPAVPFKRLVLERGTLNFGGLAVTADAELIATSPNQIEISAVAAADGAAGIGKLSATGLLRNDAGSLSADVRLRPSGQLDGVAGEGDLALRMTRPAAGDSLSGTLTIDGLQGKRNGPTTASLGGANGRVDFVLDADGVQSLVGDVTLIEVGTGISTLSQVPIRFSLEDDQASVELQIDAPESGLLLTGVIDGHVHQLREELPFVLQGSLLPGSLPFPTDLMAEGAIRFQVEGQVHEPLALASSPPAAWTKALSLAGRADIDLRDIRYADRDMLETLRGQLAWSLDGDTLLVDAEKIFSSSVPIPANVTARFGDLLPDRLGVQLGGPDATPPSLRIAPVADGWDVAFATGVSVPHFGASAEADLRIELDPTFQPRRFSAPFIVATLSDLSPLGLDGSAEVSVTDFAGTPSIATAELTGTIALPSLDIGGISGEDVNVELGSAIAIDGQTMTFQLAPSTRVSFDALKANGLSLGSNSLALAQDAGTAVINDDGSATYDLSIAPVETTLTTTAGPVELVLADLRITGSETSATIAFADAAAAYPPRAARAEDVAGTLDIDLSGQAAWNLAVGRLYQDGSEPAGIPVSLTQTGSRDPDGTLRFDAHATNDAAGLDLRVRGSHDPAASQGQAEIVITPLRFGDQTLQPGDLIPRLAELLTEVAGTVGADGTIAWQNGTVESDLEVALNGLDLKANKLDLRGLTGDLKITGLRPPATAPDQSLTLSIHQGKLGSFPVDLTFQLQPDGRLAIDTLTVSALGGRISAGQTDIAIDDPFPLETSLQIADVDLAQLLELTNVQGLTGSGRLSGQIPLRVEDRKVAIDNGELAAAGSGVVQFDRAKLPAALLERGDIVSMALETLTDFNYDSLDMQISKSLDGDGIVNVQLSGANPAVLEGHPFRFNIALESDFDRLAQLVTQGLAAADTVLFNAAEGATP